MTAPNYWQIACGDTNRSYEKICLDWGVVLNGSGSYGPWKGEETIKALKALPRPWSSKKISDHVRFCEQIHQGDLVVLRLGTSRIEAVGQIMDDKASWSDEFGDVDGWDLQHYRRVWWFWKKGDANPLSDEQLKTYALKFGDTTQELKNSEIRKWVDELYAQHLPSKPLLSKMVAIPDETMGEAKDSDPNGITISDITDYLYDHGISNNAINDLTDSMEELVALSKWYWKRGVNPSERESVAYLVIPLMRALGWTPQRMSIEWNFVDVAFFDRPPILEEKGEEDGEMGKDSNDGLLNRTLVMVGEAKRFNASCLNAVGQAHEYVEKHGNKTGAVKCNRMIVTDGVRYGVFVNRGDNFGSYPRAYLNLTRLRDKYPILNCQGAKQALLYMSPDWRE